MTSPPLSSLFPREVVCVQSHAGRVCVQICPYPISPHLGDGVAACPRHAGRRKHGEALRDPVLPVHLRRLVPRQEAQQVVELALLHICRGIGRREGAEGVSGDLTAESGVLLGWYVHAVVMIPQYCTHFIPVGNPVMKMVLTSPSMGEPNLHRQR